MKLIFTGLLTFLPFFYISIAQTNRSLTLASDAQMKVYEGKTYALIVGISKYKNSGIPQLQYADRDAIAFKNYLIATGADSNNITLLLNEKATNGEFWASLNLLTDISKQGDKVFIYFSGHGDVENKTVVKDAYLLPYDAPKCVYPAGAIAVPLLKSWLATLSANGVQAIFIADACRSGNLAGGREGMEAAATMLKDKWQEEIKILSCQPGEFSLEGKEWGGGRGLFSYELINGLAGLADKNKDGKVTLRELNLYLMEKVAEEASPISQTPMILGDMNASIALVNPSLLAGLSSQMQSTRLQAMATKGFEESLLMGLSDEMKENYRLFNVYMDTSRYVIKDGDSLMPSAWYYLQRIPENANTKFLTALMKRNLCAGIMKRIDKKLNTILSNHMPVFSSLVQLSYESSVLRDILGDEKLARFGYLPKVLCFEALFGAGGRTPDKASLETGIRKLDSAIVMAPGAAYLYVGRGFLNFEMGNPTRAIDDERMAIAISPRFVYPYALIGEIYHSINQDDSANIAIYDCIAKLNIAAQQHLGDTVLLAGDYTAIADLYSDELDDNAMATEFYEKAFAISGERRIEYCYKAACCFSLLKEKPEALKYLKISFESGRIQEIGGFGKVVKDKSLDNIRHEPEFKALIKKYFPGQYKN